MSVNNDEQDQELLESLDTLSLNDYHSTQDEHYISQDHHHRNPPSPTTDQDFFEFCSGRLDGLSEEPKMSHAEDMISGGKLIPINNQPKKHIRRQRRSESMHELTSSSSYRGTAVTASQLVRNSYSFDHKKHNKNSRLYYEPTSDNHRSNLSNKTSSSRWSDVVFGPVKMPPEMDLRDIRNRQIVKSNASKSLFLGFEGNDHYQRVGYHKKSSWGVLGILSCKSSVSVAVRVPLS